MLIPVKYKDKFGFIDTCKNEVVFDFIFDWVLPQTEGYYPVRKGNQWGFVSINGSYIPIKYEEVKHFSEGFAPVKYEKWGYININGDFVVEPKFEDAGEYDEGFAPVKYGGKWGFINKSGCLVIDYIFEDVRFFLSGLCPVKINGKWGIINKRGQIIIEPKYDDIFELFSINEKGELIYEVSKDGKKGRLFIKYSYEENFLNMENCKNIQEITDENEEVFGTCVCCGKKLTHWNIGLSGNMCGYCDAGRCERGVFEYEEGHGKFLKEKFYNQFKNEEAS